MAEEHTFALRLVNDRGESWGPDPLGSVRSGPHAVKEPEDPDEGAIELSLSLLGYPIEALGLIFFMFEVDGESLGMLPLRIAIHEG
jgi:hypothetical protein